MGQVNFLRLLLEEGFNVHGFDASDHMLGVLDAKAKVKYLKSRVWKVFVEDLQYSEQ